MHAPRFWQSRLSPFSLILMPFSWLYYVVFCVRKILATPYKVPQHVICIGNITTGGSGKTPVAMEIARIVQGMGKRVVFLSRGYGGTAQEPLLVDTSKHGYQEVGDEVLLLSRVAPVVVAKHKANGLAYASKLDCDVIILDDGKQNPSVYKDTTITVIRERYGWGNGRIFPAGPLRETVQKGLNTSDLVVVNCGASPSNTTFASLELFSKPIIYASITSTIPKNIAPQQNYFAFCGIGHPQGFIDTLASLHIPFCDTAIFPDHHAFTESDLHHLRQRAASHNALLLTTEKDWVRLPSDLQTHVTYLPIRLTFDKTEHLHHFLQQRLETTANA